MNKFIFVIILLLSLVSCSKDQDSYPVIVRSPVMDEKDLGYLNQVSSKLRGVSKGTLEALHVTRLENEVEELISSEFGKKGNLIEAQGKLEELNLFKTNLNKSEHDKKIAELERKLTSFIDGKIFPKVKPLEIPKTTFQNAIVSKTPERSTQLPATMSEKLSLATTAKSWLQNTTDSYSCSGISISNPNPQGSSLSAVDFYTRRTPELIKLSEELGTVEDVFKYVRDNVKHWPSFGATQSAHQVAISGLGTFIDKSTLLISLLRAKGISAQYILGDVLVDEDKLKGIWGVEGRYDLVWALAFALEKYWKMPGKGGIFYVDGTRKWLIPHAWVRAYIDGEWKVLDPSNIYYEHGAQSPLFRNFDLDIDFDAYLTGANQRGQFEKPGTILDFILETAFDQIRSEFGNGVNLKDIDLIKFGKPITPEGDGLPYGTMAYNGGGCPFFQEDLLPSSYISKFNLKMKKGTQILFDGLWDVPEVAEKGITTIHTAGLFGRVGNQDGALRIYLGDIQVGSFPIRTVEAIDLDYSIDFYPVAYGPTDKIGSDRYSIIHAGDVYAFTAYHAPRSKDNLEIEVTKLKDLVSDSAAENEIYGQFLRTANTLTLIQEFEQLKTSSIVTSVGSSVAGVLFTHGTGGVVKDREDRPYGAVPLGTGINWITGGSVYSRSGNFTSFIDYTNVTDYSLLVILNGSQIEANIWEILYGVPGGSSTKLNQIIAKDINQNGYPNIFVKNEQLGVGRDAEILAKFDEDMLNLVASTLIDFPIVVKRKNLLYSQKSAYQNDSGFTGKSVILLPTVPNTMTAAFYGGVSGPVDGTPGTRGGGSTGDAADPFSLPAGVDVNDPFRRGAASSCNPVSYATGDMFHDFSDFVVRGRTGASSIRFERKYSTKPYKPLGDLGPGWTHNFQTRLVTDGFDDLRPEIQGNIIWIKEGGNKVVFYRNANGTYQAPEEIREELVELEDHFEVRLRGGNLYAYGKDISGVPAGRFWYFEEVHGERIIATYDSNNLLESVESPYAGEVSFIYDGQNRIIEVLRERDNLSFTYAYNTNGYLESSTDYDNYSTRYEYVNDRPGTKAQNLLNKILDPLNHEIAFEYYDDGRVFQEFGKGGAKTTYFYSNYLVDHLTRVRGENGATKLYKFDDQYRLIETEYEDGSRIKQMWDEDSNMVASYDELGYKTEFVYDERGNRIGVKAPEHSDFVRTEYHPVYDKPTRMIPLIGAVTQMIYDESNGDLQRMESVDSQGVQFLQFVRDPFGGVVSTTNNETSYSDVRDNDGLLTQKFDLRNPINQEYDSRGRITRRSYANGKVVQMEYDDFDRVTRITNNSGPDVINEYDPLGRLITRTVTDGASSKISRFEYDARDRQIATIDPQGRRTEMKYDIPGLGCKYVIDSPVMVIDPNGRKSKFEYDTRNRKVRSVAPDGTVTRKEYNDRGDLIAITDGVGNRSTFRYDGNRRLIREERSSSKSSINGQPMATTTVILFKYDEADRLIREEMLLPGLSNGTETAKLVTVYEYNPQGQVTTKKIQREFLEDIEVLETNTFTYKRLLDAPSQLTANNEHVELGFVTENQPPFSMTSYSVNSSVPSNELGIVEGVFNIENDPTGQIKRLSQVGQANPIFVNEYDAEGRMTKKTSRYNGHRLISTIGYDSFGRKSSLVHDSGLSATMGYDILDRLVSLSYTGEGQSFSEDITYEEDTGNITNILREIGSFDLNYDGRDQLVSVNYSSGSIPGQLLNRSIDYDRSGNRLDDTLSGEGRFIRNAIIEDAKYRYYTDSDGFGNIVQRTDKANKDQHVYDYWNDGKLRKLTKYEMVPNSTQTLEVDYYFDALGRRVAKKIKTRSGEFTQSYTYLGMENKILLARSGNGNVQLQVDGQGIDDHLAEINRSGVKTLVSDHLGTVINSEVTDQYKTTGAFGEMLQLAPELESSTNPVIYAFTGRQYEPESGLYYYRNRMYDSESGRFMTKDPIGIRGGDVNLYRYVSNSPFNLTDPMGLAPGDFYTTEGAAADAAFRDVGGLSRAIDLEAGGYITRQDTGYTYTQPIWGSSGGVNIGAPPSLASADYHTHGGFNPGGVNDNFSSQDTLGNIFTGLNGYVNTPGGYTGSFNYQSSTIQGVRNSCGP